MYPQDWMDQLILHEFRHATQYTSVNHGFTKALSYILGEQGTFVTIVCFVPLWFIEGDATLAETALHYTGRGRTPSFEMRLRAQFTEKGIYSYEKANNGSYKDFVPNKYELGYQLVGLTRELYGPLIWSNVMSRVGRRAYSFAPFSLALKKEIGLNKYGLYDSVTNKLRDRWLELDQSISKSKFQQMTRTTSSAYLNYNLPVFFRDSLTIAVKSSLDDLTKFVCINKDGIEKKLFTAGVNYIPESLSASDSIIYWSEMTNDPRWSFRDYRVIKSFNYNTQKLSQITHKTRYVAPSVSPDGKSIVAVEVTLDNRYYLVILNAVDGSLINRISSPENLLFIHPRWSEDGKSIVSVVFGKEGNNLALIDPGFGKIDLQLPYSYMEIKRPSFYLENILYTASYNGIDNIYALNTESHEVFQVTNARFGASDASVKNDPGALVYSNYTSHGYQLALLPWNPVEWKKITIPVKSAFPLAEKMTEQENFIFNCDSVPKVEYESKPYCKALNLFNFHSWAPLGFDIQNTEVSPGVTFLSQNLLGTNIASLGYLWNRNQQTGKYFIGISNESLYPAIDLNFDYGDRKDIQVNESMDSVQVKWSEFNLSTGIRIPLKWTQNVWIRSFQPSVHLKYTSLKMDKSVGSDFMYDKILAASYSFLATNKIKTSARDLFPKWGQQIQFDFENTPFEEVNNSIFAGQATLDFPGLFRHHGLRLYTGFQKKIENYYTFADKIIFPRGQEDIFRDEMVSCSALYSLPLFLPDWQIGHFIYIKRVKSAFFYDFLKSYGKASPDFFSSTGMDITMDFSLFNFVAPFDAGLRSIYIPESGEFKFQFLFSINLNSIY
jgi:hypothetical protein